ncbi:AAA family ATPase [Candidatus Woesearchaeota archaeon]|nr:AAA family ATPase [Candidatus Woesearchaeota archaeon]
MAQLQRRAKIVVITGTPGVGKSRTAQFLQKKYGWRRLDLHQYYKELSEGYNRKKKCYNLNLQKVTTLVHRKSKENDTPLVIDSHIAHHLSPKIVDLCVVLTYSNLKTLQRRLQRRGYSREKVRENLDAEIFQICQVEAVEKGHSVIVFDQISSQNLPRVALKIQKETERK